ncbi:MAG: helix-hairpin-helix domain-containing protein [Chloroflexi bacterium]|nr:helix-hairpin-helix domain-containing protein [Chloroflexota bacterium]
MEQLAPDWRSIGTPPTPDAPGSRARAHAEAVPVHLIALIAGGIVSTVLLGALAAWLVVSSPTGAVVGDDGHEPRAGLAMSVLDVTPVLAPAVASPIPARVVVDVQGAVVRPGLVEVPAGGRVGDAIALAGGFGPRVDLAAASHQLNLAELARDGTKVHVPAIGDVVTVAAPSTGGAETSSRGDGRVDLNTATEAELDALPGVGPATIAKIVAARTEMPFRTPDEIRSRGIVGQATWLKLEALVTVGR